MRLEKDKKILLTYNLLYKEYGPQGWWPLLGYRGDNPTKTGSLRGYHPKDYELPVSSEQVFEICIGAVLTQNTAWPNVEKALINLRKIKAIDAERLLRLGDKELREAIKPAGYFNQKANYLKEFARFFVSLDGRVPSREELLNVRGVGKETADSILLYAYKKPEFVVDAYTRRIFSFLGFFDSYCDYGYIKRLFEENLPREVKVYQEYHALIVEHAKRCYSKKPYNCPIAEELSR